MRGQPQGLHSLSGTNSDAVLGYDLSSRTRRSGHPTTFIALLRAINLAGHYSVSMTDLRLLLSGLGHGKVSSLLQSGNLVFKGDVRETAALESLLERAAPAHLELETDLFVRTSGEWERIVSANPFPTDAEHDPAHPVVMALKDSPDRAHVASLDQAITG